MSLKILITGGTGFLGTYLAEHLLGEGNSITTFNRGRLKLADPVSPMPMHINFVKRSDDTN